MLRRTLRRLRFALVAVLTTVVIALAVLVGLTQLAMPWLVRNPGRIEAFLTERLHEPVHIDHVGGRWIGGGPVLTLDRVRIGTDGGAGPLEVPRAELALDLYAPFLKNRAWSEFRLVGLDVRLVRGPDGWQMRGLHLGDVPAPDRSRERVSMGALGVLVLKDFKLAIEDASHDLDLSLGASELRVENQGDVVHVAGKVRNLATESASVDLIADIDPERRSGEIYVGGNDVDIGGFAAGRGLYGVEAVGGRGVAGLWVRVDGGDVDDVRLRVDLADAALAATTPVTVDESLAVAARAHFERLAFVARWQREDAGWTFDVADLSTAPKNSAQPSARLTIERRADSEGARYRAAAVDLALEPIGSLAMLADPVPAGLRRWLYLAHPQGLVGRAAVDWHGAGDFTVDATLAAAGFSDAERVPGIERFDGEIHGDAEALMLTLPQQALRIEYPRVFRRPFLFSSFGGDVVAYRRDDAWRIETDRIAFEGEGYGGELRGGAEIQDDHSRPLLDLYAYVAHADVPAAKLFWPTNSMSPKAIEWLDRALVSGTLDDGRVLVRGDLDSWPFKDNAGRFEARGHVADTVFEYSDKWPRAEHLDAVASFVGESMQVDATEADVHGVRVESASATIENLSDTVLDLSVKGSGSGANLLAFLRDTPIGQRHEDVLKDVAISGKGDIAFTLHLPVKDTDRLMLDGRVELAGANLDDAAYKLHFIDASGGVRFNQTGFAAGPLKVGFRQSPAELTLAAGGYVEDRSHAFEAGLTGRFPASTVFADVPDLAPLVAHFDGEANWRAALAVDQNGDGAAPKTVLSVSSDLEGIAIDLPKPLAKAPDAALPLRLTLPMPPLGQTFHVALGDVLAADGRVPAPNAPLAVQIAFGGAAPGPLPPSGIAIGGRVALLDAGGWLDLAQRPDAGEGEGGANALLRSIDLKADAFEIARRDFGATHLVLDRAADATGIKVDGEHLAGSVRIPAGNLAREGVTAHFQRFHWPDSGEDAAKNDADDSSGALADIAPGSLPPLHISVDDFMLGSASFGAAQFESYPAANGMHVDKLDSKSPNVNMSASGDWTGSATDNRSHLAIVLTAQNLGHMMDALGFHGLIDGGETTAHIDAVWPGPPSAFALPRLESGSIRLEVAEGRILDVEPGAGRIFGLFSLTEIPRRLSLDFTDIFKSGLSFNSIEGSFRLDDGNAYTSDLLIKSPSADIKITGRTGLRARDYDQQMVVTPHTSATLPLVGAIAGGPVGAAAGLVLQGVLGRPLGKAMASRYTVTGSWDKPKITLVAREKAGGKDDTDENPKTPGGKG